MKVLILVTMFFCHIVDDYYLQGVLANMKQKSWWEKQTSNKLYKYDYIIALIEHAFSWSFVMMLPILVYMIATNNIGPKAVASYVVMIIYNLWFHSYIDNQKANKLQINLIKDQMWHFFQIVATWLIMFYVAKI